MSTLSSDLLLIQPPTYGAFSPPLGLATLAGYLRANGIAVKALDYNIDFYNYVPKELRGAWNSGGSMGKWTEAYPDTYKPLFREFVKRVVRDYMMHNPKYVGISLLQSGVEATYDLIDTIREYLGQDVKIIVGGPHIGRDEAEEFLTKRNVLCAFQGEAEIGLLRFLQQSREEAGPRMREIPGAFFIEDGQIVGTGTQALHDIETLPYPDFSDFNLESYAFKEKLLPITTSRGCVAKCTFCGETNFMDRFRQVTAKRIVGEIRHGMEKHGVSVFRLNDSLINGNPKILEGWIDELLETDIKIVFGAAQARISDKMTPVLLDKLQRAGCYLIQYGVETGSDRMLKIMRKGITSRLALDVIHRTKKAGIVVQINIIVGHFNETLSDFLKTLFFIFKGRKDIDVINISHYGFDKRSPDTANSEKNGITNKFSEHWKAPGWQNNFRVRTIKANLVLGLMKLLGMREP
ncbi:MAG: radical SAM protein [Bdellovibrionia bacterium]